MSEGGRRIVLSDEPPPPTDVEAAPPLPIGLRVLGLVLYTAAGVGTAAFEVLLIPLRIGSSLAPIAVLLAVVTNIALPRLSRVLTGTTAGAVPPVIGWIVTVAALAVQTSEGDVLLPGGSTEYVSYGVMLGGLFAGVLTVLVLAGGTGPSRRRAEAAVAASAAARRRH